MTLTRRYPNTPPRRVKEGERILENWVAEFAEQYGEWAVIHYVGGEEHYLFDDWFETKAEAEDRCEELNAEAEVYEYFRDWEGD